MSVSVYGMLKDRAHVAKTMERFQEAGFRVTDIAVLYPYNNLTQEFAHEHHTKLPEGVTYGTLIGGSLGIMLSKRIARFFCTKATKDDYAARSSFQDMLGGFGVGSFLGGIAGAILGAQIPEYEAKRYHTGAQDGRILMSVLCDDNEWAARAKVILQEASAKEVATDKIFALPNSATSSSMEAPH